MFHGFYYFTPIQERIMRLLEKVGVQLIFLFSYDDKYPYANEIWRKTYSIEKGYPETRFWNMEHTNNVEPYGEIFEGRKAKISNKLQMKEYASVMEFVHGMKHAIEQEYYIYSSNANMANQILRDFYPEQYGERKILSYPIGQFVNTLNKMWDEDLQDIVLDEDKLMDCFSSGWLAIDGVSGKQYIQDLMYIIPFSGCMDYLNNVFATQISMFYIPMAVGVIVLFVELKSEIKILSGYRWMVKHIKENAFFAIWDFKDQPQLAY